MPINMYRFPTSSAGNTCLSIFLAKFAKKHTISQLPGGGWITVGGGWNSAAQASCLSNIAWHNSQTCFQVAYLFREPNCAINSGKRTATPASERRNYADCVRAVHNATTQTANGPTANASALLNCELRRVANCEGPCHQLRTATNHQLRTAL